jgi:hypothetical protein
MSQEKQPQRKKIESTGQMMKIMSDYFYDLDVSRKTTRPCSAQPEWPLI